MFAPNFATRTLSDYARPGHPRQAGKRRRKWTAKDAHLFRARSFRVTNSKLLVTNSKLFSRSFDARLAKFVQKNATRKRGAAVKS